jgi:hypothetical protein
VEERKQLLLWVGMFKDKDEDLRISSIECKFHQAQRKLERKVFIMISIKQFLDTE